MDANNISELKINLVDRKNSDSLKKISLCLPNERDERDVTCNIYGLADDNPGISDDETSGSGEFKKDKIMQSNFNKNYKTELIRRNIYPMEIIEEIKQNYENEISVLRKQMEHAGLQGLSSEDALQKRCYSLEFDLKRARNEAESLSDQVSGLRTQLQTWPSRIKQLEDDNEMLRNRVCDLRTINQQRQNDIDWLREIVKTLEAKLWNRPTTNSPQEKIFVTRVMSDYESLLKDFEHLKLQNLTNERKLCEAELSIHDLTSELTEIDAELAQLRNDNISLKHRLRTGGFTKSYNYRVNNHTNKGTEHIDFENTGQGNVTEALYASPRSATIDINPSINSYKMIPIFDKGIGQSYYNLPERITDRKTFNENQESGRSSGEGHCNESKINFDNERRRYTIQDWSKEIPTKLISKRLQCQTNEISYEYNMAKRDQAESVRNNSNDECEGVAEDNDNVKRYEQLQSEKKRLLIQLSHIPKTSAIMYKKTNRDLRENLESQLDHVDRQLGAIRTTFTKKSFKK